LSYIGSKPANKPVVASDLDPTVITGQTALAVAPAATDEFLISDAGTLKRLDASLIGGANTPAFEAMLDSDQSLSNTTWTKVEVDNEFFDTNSTYDNSTNYRFTPAVAGKYFIHGGIRITNDAAGHLRDVGIGLYKNGSAHAVFIKDSPGGDTTDSAGISIIDVADADDYYELYAYGETGSGSMVIDGGTYRQVWFGAFKIIE
jgi:hypothetical protein